MHASAPHCLPSDGRKVDVVVAPLNASLWVEADAAGSSAPAHDPVGRLGVREGERLLSAGSLSPTATGSTTANDPAPLTRRGGHLLRKVNRERELIARAHVATVTLL